MTTKKPATTPPERPKRKSSSAAEAPRNVGNPSETAAGDILHADERTPTSPGRAIQLDGGPACPVCGTARVAEVCHVDGHRFGAAE